MRIPLIIENAEERHMNISTTYTTSDGSKQRVIITIITSSSDATIITKKQYVTDNIKERDKPQRIRVLKNIVKITEEQYNERYNTFTTEEKVELEKKEKQFDHFFSSENGDYENINVNDKMCSTIQKKFNEHTIKVVDPVVFDKNQLKTLAEKAYTTQIDENHKQIENKYNLSKSQDQDNQEKTMRRTQKKASKEETNRQYNYDKRLLDPTHKKLLEARDVLEEKEQKYKQKKFSEKQYQANMERKKQHAKNEKVL